MCSTNIDPGISEVEICRQLNTEDEQDSSAAIESLHKVTPNGMLVELLEIEEQ